MGQFHLGGSWSLQSPNLETHKTGNGNSLRPRSRARSEASDITNENDVSPTRACMQPGGEYSLGENMNSPNLQKRRTMEEEDSLDLASRPTSRPVTPSPSDSSDGNGANQTPKAKSRVQPAGPFNHPYMTEEDPPNG